MAVITRVAQGTQPPNVGSPPNTGQAPRVVQGSGTISGAELEARREAEARAAAIRARQIEEEEKRAIAEREAEIKELQSGGGGGRNVFFDPASGSWQFLNDPVFGGETPAAKAARERALNEITFTEFRKAQEQARVSGKELLEQELEVNWDAGTVKGVNVLGEPTQRQATQGRSVGTTTGSYIDITPEPERLGKMTPKDTARYIDSITAGLPEYRAVRSDAYLPNVRAKEAAIAANARAGYAAFKKQGGNVRYEVNLQDEILLGKPKGPRPVETEYYLPDPTNPFKVQSRSEYFRENYNVPDARNPWQVEPKAAPVKITELTSKIPKPSGDIFKDYAKGFEDYGKDLISIGTGKPSYSLESDVMRSFRSGSGLKSGGFTLFTPDSIKALQGVGESAISNPFYSAGSAVGSAAFFAGTGGASLVGKTAATGVKAARSAARVEKEALGVGKILAEAKGAKFNPTELSIQPVKRAKGEDVVLQKVLGTYLQSKQVNIPSLFRTPIAGVPGSTPAINLKFPKQFDPGNIKFSIKTPTIPDAFNIFAGEKMIGQQPVKGPASVFTDPMTTKQAQKLVGEQFVYDKDLGTLVRPAAGNTGLPKADEYIQFFGKETKGLREGKAPPVIDPLKGLPLSKKSAEELAKDVLPGFVVPTARYGGKLPTGDIMKASGEVRRAKDDIRLFDVFKFPQKELYEFGKGVAKQQKQAEQAAKALSEMGTGKKGSPFTFDTPKPATKQTKTSQGPLDNLNIFEFDRSLQDVSKLLQGSSKSDSKLLRNLLGGGGAGMAGLSGLSGIGEAFAEPMKAQPSGPFGYGIPAAVAKKRQRRTDESELSYDLGIGQMDLPDLGVSNDVMKAIKDMNKGITFTFERDALDKGQRFRGGKSTRSRSDSRSFEKQMQKEYEKLLPKANDLTKSLSSTDTASLSSLGMDSLSLARLESASMTATATSSAQSRTTAQSLQSSLSRMIPTPSVPRATGGPSIFDLPGFGEDDRRRRRGKRGLRYGERKLKAPDVLDVALGRDFARAFNKKFGLRGDPYGTF